MKRALALALATCAAVAAFALPSAAAARTVSIKDNFFSPASITVSRGTTITWAWRGINLHNVHKSRGPGRFKACGDRSSGRCSRTLRVAGTWRFLCTIHGFRMKIVVT